MEPGNRGDFSWGILRDCEIFANLSSSNVEYYNDNSSFHVGSGCLESAAFSRAITAARAVFLAAERLGVRLQLLDIGGGFPGTAEAEVSFREISCRIKDSLAENFGSQL